MIKIKHIIAAGLLLSSTMAFADESACQSLQSLHISTVDSNYFSVIPLFKPGNPECGTLASGYSCYEAVNWTKTNLANGWTIQIETPGSDSDVNHTDVINGSTIFSVVPVDQNPNDGDIFCKAVVNTAHGPIILTMDNLRASSTR